MAKVGRPLLFIDVKELEKKIQVYFDSCFEEKWFDEDKRDEKGEFILDENKNKIKEHIKRKVQIKPLSITGLAVALDCSRDTLVNYEEKSEFFGTIRKAKDFIEHCIEDGLLASKFNVVGSIFTLKNNWDWKEKTELEHSGEINNPYANLTDEQIRQKLIDRGRQEEIKNRSDIFNGGNIELPKDGANSQRCNGVSGTCQGVQEGDNIITQESLKDDNDNNKLDNSTTTDKSKPEDIYNQ
jgi:hypothetical protein